VTPNDRFHLGSDTEAMTALLAAMFVEDGKLVRGLSSPEETIIEK
jgi:CubicO group peptidase (beta-lactamase class C family)